MRRLLSINSSKMCYNVLTCCRRDIQVHFACFKAKLKYYLNIFCPGVFQKPNVKYSLAALTFSNSEKTSYIRILEKLHRKWN